MEHKYLEDLIAKYQERADSLSERAKELCGDTSTVSTYKWIHSLAVTYGEFADVLDYLVEEMKPQTNGDWIRNLSDEDLATIIAGNTDIAEQIPFCQNLPECQAMLDGDEDIPTVKCEECMLMWLRRKR